MVTDAAGAPIVSVAGAPAGAALSIEFADGKVGARVEGAPAKPLRSTPKKDDGKQGSLL
jgi:hypothetical protein